MTDENEKKETGEDISIEKLLRDREKLDEQLKERFSREVTVMFTDIKGSTSFFETYGDIEGRLMLQKHNELLFPLVEKHKGRIIKTIGDAIMAAFEGSVAAVRCAIDMQEALFKYNSGKKEGKDHIHIRVGINTGEGIVEKKDIFGDVVNVAARIESLTDQDEIMISSSVYEDVRKTDDILCRYASQAKLKGKKAPIEVFRVVWGDEESVAGLTRSASPSAKKERKEKGYRKRLEIDISREADLLRITTAEKHEKGENTIQPYEEVRVSMTKIDKCCQEITALLNQTNQRGKVSKDILSSLRDVGNELSEELLSARSKKALRDATVHDLVLHIQDNLVQIPWELLYDGEQFLCQKFNMGRVVKTKHEIVNTKNRWLSRPLKMLIVSDPRGDLENSFKEGQVIRELLDGSPLFISANQKSGQITSEYIMEKIKNFDVIHYAGHADYDPCDPSNSGWILDGGKFSSSDIMKLAGGRPMPALVFCNACRSGQTAEWKIGESYNQEIFGLANAFLFAGVQHYVGTFWEIQDETGVHFAMEFYRATLEGASIGEAIRRARLCLIRKFGEDTIVWASYMLYGDPGFSYLEFEEETAASGEATEKKETEQVRGVPGRQVSSSARFPFAPFKKASLAAAVLVAVALAFAALFLKSEKDTALEKESPAYFNKSEKIQQGDPDTSMFLAQENRKQNIQMDRQRQQQIDKLVGDLVDKFKNKEAALAPAKKNSSGPVVVSFLDFKGKGTQSLWQGEDDFFLLKVTALLQEGGKVQIVERAIMDKLLSELKLSSTELADPSTALRLGRILSAGVIATGSIARYKNEFQVSVKLTDTETTMVKGIIIESGKQLDKIAQDVADKIAEKIKTGYPRS